MNELSILRFGFALACSGAIAYLGCAFVMSVVPEETSVQFFNRLVHGVDFGPILRRDTSTGEMALGVLQIFVVGWLIGAVVACFYNLGGMAARARAKTVPARGKR